MRVLKEAEEGRTLERVDLADRQLRLLPEPVGRIRGLLALDVSRNQLKVRDSCTPTVHAPLPPPSLSLSRLSEWYIAVRDLFRIFHIISRIDYRGWIVGVTFRLRT